MNWFSTLAFCAIGAMGTAQAAGIEPSSASFGPRAADVPPVVSAVLYDQYDNDSAIATSSQDFEAANDIYDDQAADDFVVPGGQTWSITEVDAAGQYFNGAGPSLSFNVYFYADAGGLPGPLVTSQAGLAYTNDASPMIPLSPPVVLPQGTYWVSVQSRLDFGVGGQWGWEDRTVQSGSPAAWQNPGGGFGVCPIWAPKMTCVASAGGPDMLFRLIGTTGGGTCPGGDTFCSFEQAPIPDDGYDGTLGSMACTDIDASSLPAGSTVTNISMTAGITHTYAGDLTAKLVSPDGSILGVFSRPGLAETADDGSGCCGESSDLVSTSPLTFDDAAPNDAELMGSTTSGVICQDDGICDFFPDPGAVAVPPSNFAGFIGETAPGTWEFCVGDGGGGDTGTLDNWTITIGHTGGGGTPVADISPTSLDFSVTAGGSTSAPLTIANVGAGMLDWSIAEAEAAQLAGPIFDTPSAWTSAAPIPANLVRYAFAQDGDDLYVAGGVADGTQVNTLYRYDAAADAWTTLTPMPISTGEAPTAAYFNGKLYVVGGSSVTALNIYDIATDTWSSGANFPDAGGTYGAAGGAFNGKFFVAGGTSGAGSTTLWVYDIASDSWSAGTSLPSLYYLGGYQQVGQYVYLVGSYGDSPQPPSGPASTLSGAPQRNAIAPNANGSATLRLDMSSPSGIWTTGPAWTMGRADFALAYDPGTNSLYAIGGDANGGGYFDAQPEVDQLDLSTWPAGTWVVSDPALPAPLQANQAGFYTTAMAGGEIWSTGGLDPGFIFHNDHQYRTNGSACSSPSDVPWLSESPTSGSVAAGSSQDSTITVDASALAVGSYAANLCVTTNDPMLGLAVVPVSVTVTAVTHTVTPSVGTPSGTITPDTPQTVNDGDTIQFTLTPDAEFQIGNVGGSCGGTLAGNVFTTNPVMADCTVIANFANDTIFEDGFDGP